MKYNAVEPKNERSFDNERNNIHTGRRLSSSGLEVPRTAGSNSGQMGKDEEKILAGRTQNHILQSVDERNSDTALGRSGRESNGIGGEFG